VEIHCIYDPASLGGEAPDGRKVRGTIHWVSAAHALDAEVRLYDRLFRDEDPEKVTEGDGAEEKGFLDNLNPDSLQVVVGCKVESTLVATQPGDRFQFMREGYFCTDLESTADHLAFNRTIALRDTWAKIQGAG